MYLHHQFKHKLMVYQLATSSYESVGSGIISGSVLRTLDGTDVISGSAQITALGFVSSSGDTIPAGTISGSEQITELGFVSESGGENTSLNSYTSSTDDRLDKHRIINFIIRTKSWTN